MDSIGELPSFLLLVIGLAVVSFIYLLFRIITIKKGVYRNALGLSGMPRIEELRVKDGWSIGAKVDEFVHIADSLKEWKRQRKSLADYAEDEEHKEALLRDLYELRDWIALELREEKSKSSEDQSQRFIERREYFLSDTVPYEEGRLLSWEPQVEDKEQFPLDNLRGDCFITYQAGAVTKLRLELRETGLISIGWKQAGDIGEEKKVFEEDVNYDGRRVALLSVGISPPRKSGDFYIRNRTRNTFDRVPVS